MSIRKYKQEEVESLMSIWLHTNILAHSFIPMSYWRNNAAVVKKDYIPNSTTYVHEHNGVIVGFISIIDDNFVGALFIDTLYQGRGFGKRLLDFCKERYSHLRLSVYVENQQALSFYIKQGFEVEVEQKNENSGFDEYLMNWSK